MAEQVYQFASADGVTQIHGVKWTPEGQPVALCMQSTQVILW